MVDETVVNDIRRLLKTFGVQADAAIIQQLQQHPEIQSLKLRIHLEDLTLYTEPNALPLNLSIEGSIKREDHS